MNAIEQAIALADRPENEGNAYSLLIHTSDGKSTEVDVYRLPYVANHHSRDVTLLRYRTAADLEAKLPGGEVVFNPDHVIRVDVLW